MNAVKFHQTGQGSKIAFVADRTDNPATGVFWLGGFMSDMEGSKVEALANWAEENDRPCMRFDYSGHGRSGGNFRDGTISRWLAEAVEMFSLTGPGKQIVIGSSMGGWLALLLCRHLQANDPDAAKRIAGLVLVAPAADMTSRLMWDRYSPEIRKTIMEDGFYAEPSEYGDEPYIITRNLIEDGRQHLLLDRGLDVDVPVRFLQGEADRDVPWRHALDTYHALRGDDVVFTLVRKADHRMSTPPDIARLLAVCDELCRFSDAGQ